MSSQKRLPVSASFEPYLRRLAVFVLVLILFSVILIITRAYDNHVSTVELRRAEVQFRGAALAMQIDSTLLLVENKLYDLSEHVSDTAGSIPSSRTLRQALLTSPYLSDIRVYQSDGSLIARASTIPSATSGLSWAQYEISSGVRSGLGSNHGELTFFYAGRYQNGDLAAIFVAVIDAGYFSSESRGLSDPNQLGSALIDHERNLIALSAQADPELGRQLSSLLTELPDGHFVNQGARIHELADRVVSLNQLNSYPLRLVDVYDDQGLRISWLQMIYDHWTVVLFTLLIMIFSGLALFRSGLRYHAAISNLQKLNLTIAHSPAHVVLTDLDGSILYVNDAFSQGSGYDFASVTGKNPRLLQSGLMNDDTYQELWRTITAGQTWRGTMANRTRDGEVYWVDELISPLRDDEGHFDSYIGVGYDISDKVRTEGQLRMMASVFEHALEGIVVTDAAANIMAVNDAYLALTGYDRNELIGQNPRSMSSGRHDPAFYHDMWRQLTEHGYWRGEVWNKRRNDEYYAITLAIRAVVDANGQVERYIGLCIDITRSKLHEAELEHSAHFDALTDLPNRALLIDRLHQSILGSIRTNSQVCVVFIDLDGFKEVNDRYGHNAGDHVLRTVASRMREPIRQGDTIGRLGGDEFLALLPDFDELASGARIIERLLAEISRPISYGQHTLKVSCSMGIALSTKGQDVDPELLIRQADQAMYQAKLAGKNRFHHYAAQPDRSDP